MFTKQHYERIAQLINWLTEAGGKTVTKKTLIANLIVMFSADNPRFNPDKFMDVCYENNPSGKTS